MNNFTYSSEGIALTTSFEGLRLTAYFDIAGTPTIGYGHAGPDVHPGMSINMQEAKGLLLKDIHWAVEAVNRLVTVEINQNQFDALVDFAFNVGIGHFEESTLLRLINQGQITDAASQFDLWRYVGNTISAAIERRRAAEQKHFLKPMLTN